MTVNKENNDIFLYPFRNPDINIEERLDDLVSRLTLEEKINVLPGYQAPIERLGIKPYYVGGEGAHGLVRRQGKVTGKTTVFPQPIGLSSTWNPTLMSEIGKVISDEARAYYKKSDKIAGLNIWAPTVDMERDPRWGRTEEAYGEDPCLTGKLSAALTKAERGEDPFYLKMVPTLKHFYANNYEKERIFCSSSIDPRNKYEYYLKAFKPSIVEGGAQSIMTSYNAINGVPGMVNPEIQTILKDQWGLESFTVSDGGAVCQVVDYHKYYVSHAETIANSIKAGLDSFTDNPDMVIAAARDAIERGLMTEDDIDKAVRNIFRTRIRLGQLDPEGYDPYDNISDEVICSEENSAVALKAAREAIVLLKNENNILPLNKDKLKKVAVIGPLADEFLMDWYAGIPPYCVTPLEGIKKKLQGVEVTYTDANDIVTLTSILNNKLVAQDNENENILYANKTEPCDEALFKHTDWGLGSHTLRCKANNKYVSSKRDAEGILAADQVEAFGWFVKELFNFERDRDDSYYLRTWNFENIAVGDDDKLFINTGRPKTEADKYKFKKNLVSSGIEDARNAAKDADVAIVVIGNNPMINGKEEVDRKDIILPPAQQELIKAVYETNKNTIVVIVGTYPFAINWEQENIPAIVFTGSGGQELGTAIADSIFGDYAPAGRLSMTWYKSIDQLPDITDYDIIKGKRTYMYFDKEVLYPFGHGLTYSTFKYSDLLINSKNYTKDDTIEISCDIMNMGNIDSDEVVQLYVTALKSRVVRPFRELKGFERINIKVGDKKTVNFKVKVEDLALWDVTRNKYCIEDGEYMLQVGTSSKDIKLEGNVYIHGEIIPSRDLSLKTRAENYDDYNSVILKNCIKGGTCVSSIDNKSWLCYKDVDFNLNYSRFIAQVANDTSKATVEIRLDSVDGEIIGTLQVTSTGGLQNWTINSCDVKQITGVHDVYFTFNVGDRFNGDLRISYFQFVTA